VKTIVVFFAFDLEFYLFYIHIIEIENVLVKIRWCQFSGRSLQSIKKLYYHKLFVLFIEEILFFHFSVVAPVNLKSFWEKYVRDCVDKIQCIAFLADALFLYKRTD